MRAPPPSEAPSAPRFPYRGHMPALDGLRGIAIAVVMAFHYYLFDHHVAPLHWLYLGTRSRRLGRDLLSVRSGVPLTAIPLEQPPALAPGAVGPKPFTVTRCTR